ncbi:hypothetical protein D3C85_956980 [compost metagenome]
MLFPSLLKVPVLTKVRVDAGAITVTVASSTAVVFGSSDFGLFKVPPFGVWAVAEAWLLNKPVFTSVKVTVCLAVTVTLAPGNKLAIPAGKIDPASAPASETVTFVKVTLPVLVTTML